jgi:hypothetical protein
MGWMVCGQKTILAYSNVPYLTTVVGYVLASQVYLHIQESHSPLLTNLDRYSEPLTLPTYL